MTDDAFSSAPSVAEGDDTGSLHPGSFERQYESLFTEAMVRGGEISWDERLRLDRAAASMGLDAARVARLEAALLEAWDTESQETRANPDTLADRPTSSMPHGAAPSLDAENDGDDSPTLAKPSTSMRAQAPSSEVPFQELHSRYDAAIARGSVDDAWRISEVLVLRGAATLEERDLCRAHRSGGPVRATRALDVSAWTSLLIHPSQDRTTSEIFGLIASATLWGRISAMRRDGSLPELAPSARHDPATSSVEAVRAFGWAAATLGMTVPPVYVDPSADVAYEIVPVMPPSTRVGARVLGGATSAELAFACGRHLSWMREEHFVCTLVPSVAYLETVFHAALVIGEPSLTLPVGTKERAQVVARAIVPCLEPPQVDKLKQLVARFLSRGGRTNLRRWARAAEWTACRTGLLLCGELTTAVEILSHEPGGEARITELETFWASDAAGSLRRKLGADI